MNIAKISLVWLVANVCIVIFTLIFSLLNNGFASFSIGISLFSGFVGFICTIPSLMMLIIFQRMYSTNVVTPKLVHYVLLILGLNVQYFIYFHDTKINVFGNTSSFFIVTTISGIASLLIFYKQPKKDNDQYEFDSNKIIKTNDVSSIK